MNMPLPRLLFSARDVGAGQAIVRLAADARANGNFDVTCVLQSPAAERLQAEAGQFISVKAPVISGDNDAEFPQLVAVADKFLAEVLPDAVIVGLSGPGAGIDEALLLRAPSGVPTFAVQDFWGDVNLVLGIPASCYLVIDETARTLTRHRCASNVEVVGSIRHAGYGADVDELRRRARADQGLRRNNVLIGFMGQPLWDEAGYIAVLTHVFDSLRTLDHSCSIIYRRHPKEPADTTTRVIDIARACGVTVDMDLAPDPEPLLCAADVVITAFSTSGQDHAYLNRRAATPLGTVLYAMTDHGLHHFYRETTQLESLPPVDQGLALFASDPVQLRMSLRSALETTTRARLWRAARERLPAPEAAPRRALEVIAAGMGCPAIAR